MNTVINFPKRKEAKCAIILARVSSKEQEDGYSIDAQKHRLETYCIRKNLQILNTFEITESSTVGDRKKFMEMITYIKKQKKPIALVSDKVDRLQRSFREYPMLDGLIQEGRLELHFNTENQIIHQTSTSHERMMWSMSVMMAQSFVDSMRDNVKRSQEHKIRIGEWCGAAPVGYLNIRDENGKSNIIIDKDRAPMIRKLFLTYAEGGRTLSEMEILCKKWDLRNIRGKKSHLKKSYIHKVLNNPFYHGKMRIKGQLYPHRYEPIISKEIFDKCQAVMQGWNKKPFQYASKEFVFRGLLQCATTGRTVTADTKKRTYKSGKVAQWTYLVCWNPDNPDKKMWIREEKVLEQVEEVFKKLTIPEPQLANVIKYIREVDYTEREFVRRHRKELLKEQDSILVKLDSLMELLLERIIDSDDFTRKKTALKERLDEIDLQLKENRNGDDNFKETLISLIDLASQAYDLFKGSTVEQKRRLVNFMFSNLNLKGATLCYTMKKPFDQFIKCTDDSQWCALVDSLRTNPADISSLVEENFIKTVNPNSKIVMDDF
ncbi:recombinase family protein [Kordia sp.]|uniref:recombinase family protein n=1 Tax=Kordia sp. TaxID=1965332 RepID=UPI003D6BCB2A